MKILVTVKRVPDPEQKLKFKGNAFDLAGVSWVPNPFDEYAVEAALRLTEKTPQAAERLGEVIVVSIGPKESSQQIRSALAMGADRGILVAGEDDGLDAGVVAQVLAKIVVREQPDLVLLGKQAVDGDSNQVPQLLAGLLGWPQATFAATLTIDEGGRSLRVGREIDAGVETKRVPLPAVVSVDLRIVAPKAVHHAAHAADYTPTDGPRYASLRGIMAAKKKPIEETTAAALGVTATPCVKVLGIEPPPPRKAGVKVGSVPELVDKLRNEARVI